MSTPLTLGRTVRPALYFVNPTFTAVNLRKRIHENEFKMSLFAAPISPVKDSLTGRVSRPATVYPSREVTLQEVVRLITGDPALERLTRQLRLPLETGDKERFSELKRQTLPYVTPCGTFSYRKSDRLLTPSGLVVVDVDGLDSTAEAEALRRQLFDDATYAPLSASSARANEA